MKKNITFKLFITVVWRALCQVVRKIAGFFGFKEGTTFGKAIWRIAITCITILLVLITFAFLYAFGKSFIYNPFILPHTTECVDYEKHLSNHIVFQDLYFNDKGRIYDERSQRVVLEGIDWVHTSDDNDSLAVFAKDGKRGYLNRFTGEVAIPAIFSRAWVFSEGLAAVEKDGYLLFIDHSGNVVIDKQLEVHYNDPKYTFNNGYCIVKEAINGYSGLIDRKGNWALEPEYDEICQEFGFWKATKYDASGLFTATLDTLFKVEYPEIEVSKDAITVCYPDHTEKRFDHEGNMLVDFVIDEVENMIYETTELHKKTDNMENSPVCSVAKCQRYMVRISYYGEYYGLLDRNGKRITPPDYTLIEAIAEDLYLCYPHGIIINGKGERVR